MYDLSREVSRTAEAAVTTNREKSAKVIVVMKLL